MHEAVRFVLSEGMQKIRREVRSPRIHSILHEVGPDASGNVALWLWVVLDDPPANEMTEDHWNRIRKAIMKALQGKHFDFTIPVYVFFQTKADRISAGFPT